MKKFFFWCECFRMGTGVSRMVCGVFDVVADSQASARIALLDRLAHELSGMELRKVEFLFARCESLTEFIRKAA